MTEAREPIFSYTGHPLVDVGACVIAAYNGRSSLAETTEADVEKMVQFILSHYPCFCGDEKSNKTAAAEKPLSKYISVVLTNNSPFIAPTTGNEKRQQQIDDLLGYAQMPAGRSESCVYCGRAGKRRYRQHVPLVSGEDTFNFTPSGEAGIPVCGYCLVAIQTTLLGTRMCGGRMLLPHSDSEYLTLRLVERFLRDNRRILSMPLGDEKYPNQSGPRTVLMAALAELQEDAGVIARADRTPALTAYHMTNYGTSADVQILRLPSEVVAFVRETQRPEYREIWNYMVNRGWFMGLRREKDGTIDKPDTYKAGEHRNRLYEDLFDLPDQAGSFMRRHLNWRVRLFRDKEGMQTGVPDAWDITELFLRRVMLMERERVEAIKTLGERLANYIVEQDDPKFFTNLYFHTENYRNLRWLLLRAKYNGLKKGQQPLVTLEEFLLVFEPVPAEAWPTWSLARDLLLIKIMDELHQKGWLQKHTEELPDTDETEADLATANETTIEMQQ